MTIAVPVKAHVKEFFQSTNVLGSEPIPVRRNSAIGELVAGCFSHYPLQEIDLEDLAPVEVLDPNYLHLALKFPLEMRLVADYKLVQLGKMLEVFFEFYAIAFINGRMDVFPSLNGAAVRFAEKHQISVDAYSPDALRKLADRSRAKSDSFYGKLSVREKTNVSNSREKLSNFAQNASN